MAWNGGGSGNLSDIVHKGGYSFSSHVDLDDVVVSLPIDELEAELEAVEERLEDVEESLVEGFRKSEKLATKKAQDVRVKINDLVAEELRDFLDEMQ